MLGLPAMKVNVRAAWRAVADFLDFNQIADKQYIKRAQHNHRWGEVCP